MVHNAESNDLDAWTRYGHLTVWTRGLLEDVGQQTKEL